MSEGGQVKPGIISLSVRDKEVLYRTYMGFVAEGALFIPTQKNTFQLGDKVSMLITLMGEPERYSVIGRVVWITPKGAQGNRAAGIGVAFEGEEGKALRQKIETHLAGSLKSEEPTHTL